MPLYCGECDTYVIRCSLGVFSHLHNICWAQLIGIQPTLIQGSDSLGLFCRFLFRYKNNRTYRISISKRTDFVLFWKQNRWRAKLKAMRPTKSGNTIFPPKDARKLPKEHDHRLFCPLFRTNRYSVYSVNSAIGSYWNLWPCATCLN